MPVTISFPQFGNSHLEERIRKAVDETFRILPDDWTAMIEGRHGDCDWKMMIHGPQQFELELILSGEAEHSPEFIVTAIKHTIVGEMSG
ncbi:MAG: hypothetical protein HY644_14380 [Acidobacteria bacterium]|nr:hypothetical protein [Acidobacteriota bacterium]